MIQYGYIAMFSAAFPLCAVFVALGNFVELRADANKLSYEVRRPRYQGAQHIGTWRSVLSILSWTALLVNVLLIGFTSNSLRDYVRRRAQPRTPAGFTLRGGRARVRG